MIQKIKINLDDANRADIDLIADFLKRGKVIVYPTDTIYGLGCLAIDKKAIKKIFRIKQRDKGRPLLVLAGSMNMVKKFCHINKEQARYLKKIWPGPVTVILHSRGNLPNELFGQAGQNGGLAVRFPKSKFLVKIIKAVGAPIVSTSANIHGQRNIIDANSVEKIFKKVKPDLVVDGGLSEGKSSRIVDVRDMKNIKVLR